MDKCLNCGAELTHTEGRRKKKYCSSNCKVNHWMKLHRKLKITDLTKPTNEAKSFEQPKTNYSIFNDMEREFQELLKKKKNETKD